jgi:hypothetical protein
MHGRSGIVLVCLALVTSLVASAAATPRVERYDRLGISFEYPSTWSVTTEPLSAASDPNATKATERQLRRLVASLEIRPR